VGAPQKRSAPKTVNPKTAGTGSAAARRTVTRRKKPAPEVVYIPPKPFNRNRLLLSLAITLAVVLALSFSISIFFSVEVVTVSGAEKYDAWTVKEASGIEYGDNLLSFGKAKAAGNIKLELPYVNTVRIGIKLPNTVKIEIEEVDVTYALKSVDGNWWLISAEGKIVEQALDGKESRHTKILGVQLEKPVVGEMAIAWQDPVPPTDENGNTVPVTITAAERLNAVISIAGFLEQNKIIGKMASVDVNHLMDIQLWYGNKYQILLGSSDQLGVKIATMKAALSQVDYDEGILDIRDPNNILFREFT
jgi:cell division septal protein FtsQ